MIKKIKFSLVILILFSLIFLFFLINRKDVSDIDISNKYTIENFLNNKLDTVKLKKPNNSYEYVIDEITQVLYFETIDGIEYISSFLTINGVDYFLGSTLFHTSLSESSMKLAEVKFNDTIKLYKFIEIIGANYAKTSYLLIEDKIPKVLISIDGNTYEKDIDQDKKVETIATYGTPGIQTFLYKWDFENKNVSYIYLNEKVFNKSPSVYINDKSQIVVYEDGEEKFYNIKNDKIYKNN